MGLIVDTNVFIKAERLNQPPDFSVWSGYGAFYISVITVSELLEGVHRANTADRRMRRSVFVEGIIAATPVLAIDVEIARTYAEVMASIEKGITIGTHDVIIAATALNYRFPILTANTHDFERIPKIEVVPYII